jgi:hypothetical protein
MIPEDLALVLVLVLVLCFWGRFRDSVAVSKDVTKGSKVFRTLARVRVYKRVLA